MVKENIWLKRIMKFKKKFFIKCSHTASLASVKNINQIVVWALIPRQSDHICMTQRGGGGNKYSPWVLL